MALNWLLYVIEIKEECIGAIDKHNYLGRLPIISLEALNSNVKLILDEIRSYLRNFLSAH